MALEHVAPTLEELAMTTDIDGYSCMPGVETNLGELLTTAALAKPQGICLETQDGCYTFLQVAQMADAIRKVLRKALQSLELPTCGAFDLSSPDAHTRRADEHVVTVVLERGVQSIAAVHAVLLEGCAYNAFDVGEPVEKLRSWVEVSQPPIMISNESTMRRLNITNVTATLGGFPRMVLDVDLALKKASSTALPLRPAHAPEDLDRLAYLIFTSGSTGKPKAVMIRHKSALNVVRIWGRYVGLNEQDRFAQVASMSWDVHVIEVYGTMAARATSVTCPDLVKKSGPDMQVWLKEKQISGMSVVPSHLRTMAGGGADVSRTAAGLPHLRILDVGGEALGADVVDTWAPGRRLFNSYGPSEISVVCTGGYVQSGDVITIGAQLPTYDCYILDPETMEVKPEGERGVLFVGGIGLARGYLEEEEKTRQKFIELPGLGRVYNTGDLASRAGDGRIHYHGRVDWQVKVRGIRIELEALEQAITELPAVKHCEARVLDGGQRLVLLASGSVELSEAELKATAAALGRGYVLSQVKMVENDTWKFNTSGKLLRNAVPLDAETAEVTKKDAWESFVKEGATELEREIAACLAPQLSNVEQWDCNSHFMEDLGVDSGGFGRLISQMRARPSLQQVDLQLLFEHPTVRSLAAALALSGDDSDSDHEGGAEIAEGLVHDFMARLEEMPHMLCAESGCQSISYHQLSKLSASYQQLLHQMKHEPSGCVAICLELPGRLAAMLAAASEGRTFCVLDSSTSDLSLLEQLRVAKPQMLLARRAEMAEARWTCLEQHCKLANVICVDVSFSSLQSKTLKQRASAPVACIAFEETSDGLRALPASEAVLQQAAASWRLHVEGPKTRVLYSLEAGSVGGLAVAWACLTAGATLLAPSSQLFQKLCVSRATILVCKPEDLEAFARLEAGHARPETLSAVCLQDLGVGMPALRWAPSHLRVMQIGTAWTTATPSVAPMAPELRHGASMESIASRAWRAAGSSLSIASTLAGYVLGQTAEEPGDSFGPSAWPVLCATVQGAAILAQPVFVAARLVLAERVLLPLSFVLPLWGTFLLLLGLLFLEQFVRVGLLAVTKWLLIGRYKEGEHDIYSLMYLRHWLVEHMAKGTIVGQNAHQGSSIAFLFMRNLALKALGANVSLSSVITARVVAFDLVTVGDLATVHGPRHLTAVNYGTRRMVLKRVQVGAGAYVGPNCTLEPGCEVAAAGYVEPLSTVSSGMVVDGRVCGVPAQPVAGADTARVPTPTEARRFRCTAAVFATGYWLLLLPKALVPFLGVFFLQLLSSDYPFNQPEQVEENVMHSEHMDALPSQLFQMFCWVPLMAFGVSMINTIGQLFGTALLCRVLPKVKPPCTYPLVSIRAQIAALKMSMVLQASEMLADASIVPAFIRLCGATFGHGCAMGLQVTLPETLVVGKGCFFATGNILTSVDVDRGQFKVPCITYMSDHTFLGNHNHLPQGLPEGSFCGVGTWLPERPTEPNMSYFGNPAMKFRRLSSQAGKVNQGPEPASCLARFWHHFSTSILDVFLYRGVQGMVTAAAFVTSRVLVPDITGLGQACEVLGIYIAFALGSWYVFSVLLGNLLFNGKAPRSNAYYSTTVTRWFTALTAQQRVFKLPFQTAGSRWQAPILRLLGAKVGSRFFCMNELVLVDAPFTEIGDDVTVDYDGQVRCHSFEDFRLKFTCYKIGNGVTIMSGASVAMCDAGDGAVLRPGSLTWKGSNLVPRGTYEGAPAAAVDLERALPGPTLKTRPAARNPK